MLFVNVHAPGCAGVHDLALDVYHACCTDKITTVTDLGALDVPARSTGVCLRCARHSRALLLHDWGALTRISSCLVLALCAAVEYEHAAVIQWFSQLCAVRRRARRRRPL